MSTTSRRAIEVVPLTSLDTESQMKVRDIRNEANIRKWMYTDHVIGVDEHLAWINRLKDDDSKLVFAVLDEARAPLGVISVSAIDRLHKKTDWAYYLTETARGGLGSALEFAFIDFVFSTLGMEKLNCEVIEGNDPVVSLHKKFLFQEEGFRASNILKHGVRIGVHFLGLTKNAWLAGRADIREKYQERFDNFAIVVRWPPIAGSSS
jgi:UDP-4-amino-4,6-dideoxy-N-acetyl-beta-L-altrosamine N-acetyltransferase